MKLFADTHAHIYEIYNLPQYVECAFASISKYKTDSDAAAGVLFLTQGEKHSPDIENIFSALKQAGYDASFDNSLIKLNKNDNFTLYIADGCQFVSSEGIEVLALTYSGKRLDRLTVNEILESVKSSGAVAVLPWSPGKWLGKRKEIILSLLDREKEFLLGDIPIRSVYKPEIFNIAVRNSIKILNGGDTLPMKGEESNAAAYLCEFIISADFPVSIQSLREILLNSPYSTAGRRDSVFKAAYRWFAYFIKSKFSSKFE